MGRRVLIDHTKRQSTDVDAHVGARIRALRRQLGMSQVQLAARLGLSVQQVQKYECGVNRISASKLFEAANLLGVPVSELFDGLDAATPEANHDVGEAAIAAFLQSPQGVELASNFPRIPSRRLRQIVLEFVRGVAEVRTEEGKLYLFVAVDRLPVGGAIPSIGLVGVMASSTA